MEYLLKFITGMTFPDFVFLLLGALIVGCGIVVVFSKNIVHSAFSLLGTFSGVAGLYGMASANFIAAVQIVVYVGGVLILILFAIMLTQDIQHVEHSNPASGLIPATILGIIAATALITIAVLYPWQTKVPTENTSTVLAIGNAFLDKYLIPFELLSLVLLSALVGSVMLVRKEIKEEEVKEREK